MRSWRKRSHHRDPIRSLVRWRPERQRACLRAERDACRDRFAVRRDAPSEFAAAAHSLESLLDRISICDAMKVEHVRRRSFVRAECATGKPQISEMHGKAEPVGGAPPLTDHRQVFRRECVMPHDSRRIGRRIEKRRARLRGEDVTRGHGQARAVKICPSKG